MEGYPIEETLQFIFILIVLVKLFFFSENQKVIRKIEALEFKFENFNARFEKFRKREARALIIAKRVEGMLEKSRSEKV